jgi:hypothetical protein
MEQTREDLELRKQISQHVSKFCVQQSTKMGRPPRAGARLVLFPESDGQGDEPAPAVLDGLQVVIHDDGVITLWRDEGGIGPKFIAYIEQED